MNTPDICLIWAQNPGRAIGRDNDMPWHSKKDFAHFRETTQGCPVIMGRRTWESLPRKPLPKRVNIIVSSSMAEDEAEGAVVVRSLEDALAYAKTEALDNIFVIGGATLYNEALPHATRVYRTTIHVDVEGADTFAPELGQEWVLLKSKTDWEGDTELVFEELGRRK